MKKLLLLAVLSLIVDSLSAQIKVNSSGYVGINKTSPSYNLDWFGTGCFGSTWGRLIFDSSGYSGVVTMHPADDWVGCLGRSDKRFNLLYVDHVIARDLEETSDERMKENIKPLDSSLDKIKQLRGVKYDLKGDYFKTNDLKLKAKLEKEGKNEIGFLAQELMKVFPEIVFLDTTSNLYSVSYTRLVPVLVEAVKEQQIQIDELKKQIENCCSYAASLKNGSLVEGSNDDAFKNKAQLYQNAPNPFSTQTTIRFEIPETVSNAQLYICNMTGTLLKNIVINQRGVGSVVINGSEFNAGMYLYSLVNDGKIIDTKQMLLTE
jgi:hypothetical protein